MINTGGKTPLPLWGWREIGRQRVGTQFQSFSPSNLDHVLMLYRLLAALWLVYFVQLCRLLYSSLPAPDSAFLHTCCDSRCVEYLHSHGRQKFINHGPSVISHTSNSTSCLSIYCRPILLLLPDSWASRMAVGPADIHCTMTAVTTTATAAADSINIVTQNEPSMITTNAIKFHFWQMLPLFKL